VAKKTVVLIPFWIQETMKRNGLQLADCLKFEVVKPITSLNDLVLFYALQQRDTHLVGKDTYLNNGLYGAWANSIPADNKELLSFFTDSVTELCRDASFQAELDARLFCADAAQGQYKEAFDIYDLTPEVVGVVVNPGFFVGTGNTELQQSLVEAILKVLYVYEPSHEVAKTPLFKRFLELLSGK
jgi:hypothetical protein